MMNQDAKKFILSDPDKNKYCLAFSLKVTKDRVINDRVVIIYHHIDLEKLIDLIHLITVNQKIDQWITGTFVEGKTTFISFTGNSRKIYFENRDNKIKTSSFHNESIEWEVGDENNFKKRNYFHGRKNYIDYKSIIPPDFNEYLNFNTCLLRTDGQFYIHSKLNEEKKINFLNRDIIKNIMLMFCRFQNTISDTIVFEDNYIKILRWLTLAQNNKRRFNWISISDESFTIYIC